LARRIALGNSLGIFTGLIAMSVLIGLMALFGGVRGWTMSGPPGAALLHRLAYALSFSIVAISEEGFLRGYALIQLSRAISFWPAAIVTSAIFLALHLIHATESVMGLTQVGLIGLILAYSVRRTGAIWFALGCHGAWDFAETYLYGVPDSGMTAPGALSNVALSGPAWLTGGVTGPEASWLIFPVFAGMALVVRFALPRWQ
jgi:membrane protease YdiL (CAAX protease family)